MEGYAMTKHETIPEVVRNAWEGHALSLLTTIDHQHSAPLTHAISWVYAPSEHVVRLAIDARSFLGAHLLPSTAVNIAVYAAETLYVVYGKVTRVVALEHVPFALHCVEIAVDHVREAMYYGAKVSVLPVAEKTYDVRAAQKLDDQVFASMRAV
jgi:hypothetical protein